MDLSSVWSWPWSVVGRRRRRRRKRWWSGEAGLDGGWRTARRVCAQGAASKAEGQETGTAPRWTSPLGFASLLVLPILLGIFSWAMLLNVEHFHHHTQCKSCVWRQRGISPPSTVPACGHVQKSTILDPQVSQPAGYLWEQQCLSILRCPGMTPKPRTHSVVSAAATAAAGPWACPALGRRKLNTDNLGMCVLKDSKTNPCRGDVLYVG